MPGCFVLVFSVNPQAAGVFQLWKCWPQCGRCHATGLVSLKIYRNRLPATERQVTRKAEADACLRLVQGEGEVWDASGEKQGLIDVVWSLALGEESAKNTLLRGVSEQIQQIQTIFPRLPIDETKALEFVANLVGDTREFSGTFIEFLFKGTRGFVAELALALIALSFLYAHGGSFVRNTLKAGGFSSEETSSWFQLHRMITLRLLNDTVLTSLIRGISMGMVAHFVGGFVFLPVFLIGAFVGLVPVVGSAMVWLPVSSIIWTRGEPMTAMAVAGLCILINYLISRARAGMGKRLHEQGAWLSFMLFLGIIGGILAYGPQGFVIGPMAVVLAYGLVRFLSEQSVNEE